MRLALYLLMIVLLTGLVSAAECTDALDGMIITENTTFCSDTYDIPNGITIGADNIYVDCGTAVLRGDNQEGTAIIIENRKNVLITKCNILTFHIGLYLLNSSRITIEDCALLKNRIGIRMLNAYENIFTKISDKSTQTTLSMITSKFNSFDINKPIEEEYCADNFCDGPKDYNPCIDDDFYCSTRCNEQNDNDCIVKKIVKYEKPKKENKTAEEPEKTEPSPKKITITPKKKDKSWLLYIVFYITAFFIIQFYEHATKD